MSARYYETNDDRMAELCAYLRALRVTGAYPLGEWDTPIRPDGAYTCEHSPAADIAVEWARELLDAADVNGLHGCKLCKG